MLAVPPSRDIKDERQTQMERFSMEDDDFSLDIDFDDLFVGINDGDLLPDLEMDSEILAEISFSGGEEYSELNTFEKVDKAANSSASSFLTSNQGDQDSVTKSDESDHKRKKSLSAFKSKNPQGKRKVKVDWTPELHRRFVQAVEQLGVDKAVPSRILELMGIDCLTRHNIASHLQKYRSHKKHLLAREAEAASWNKKRQVYGVAPPQNGGKRDMNPWLAPTIGFPPPMPPMPPMPHFRPLHVWGHPSVDQQLMHVWPKHLGSLPSHHPPSPPPTWTQHPPPHPPTNPPFWHGHHQHAPGTLCFAPPMAPTRFHTQPVPGIPPSNMYKVDSGVGIITVSPGQTLPKPPLDFEPSKEIIDAAIGDVISKPWLPLPLRLKPPSVDGVMVELQRQGIAIVPPPCDIETS